MLLPHYSTSGQKQASVKVSDKIFNIDNINHNLLKQSYHYYLDKKRINLAQTKARSDVRGGGRKPWPQKGRGLARAGTIRSPLWRGGGVTFGPTGDETYAKKINKKTKVVAVRHALSLNKKQIITISSLPTDGKTATVASLLFKTLNLDRKVLLVDSNLAIDTLKAVKNLQNVGLIDAQYVNVYRILNSDWLVITEDGLSSLETRLSSLATIKE